MSNVKGKGQRLIPEELLKYLQTLKNKYPDAVDLVEANPTLEGGEASLSSVLINSTKYAVGGGKIYHHHILILETSIKYLTLNIISSSNIPYTYSTIHAYIKEITNNATIAQQGYNCIGRSSTSYGYCCYAETNGDFFMRTINMDSTFSISQEATVTDTIKEV